jgi:uncharacterized protein (TIGR02145 family)
MTENLRYKGTLTKIYDYNYPSEIDDDPDAGELEWNEHKVCGLLYTWKAAMKGICPKGWHLPSDEEWSALESVISADATSYSTSEIANAPGKKMKSESPLTAAATNGVSKQAVEGGFDALLPGYGMGLYILDYGTSAYFWTSSICELYGSGDYVWCRYLSAERTELLRTDYHVDTFFSVRCKKDN